MLGIHVWDSGLGFVLGVHDVSNSGLGFGFEIPFCDSDL